MVAAQDELNNIQNEIQNLTSEISDEAIDRKSKTILSKSAYKEMADLQEELRVCIIITKKCLCLIIIVNNVTMIFIFCRQKNVFEQSCVERWKWKECLL